MKKNIAARLPGQCIRDERLQVRDSIQLWKNIIAARLPGQCSRDERLQIEDIIMLLQYCYGKGRTLQNIASSTTYLQ